MIDFAQSSLVTLVAGAVMASCLLGVSAWEHELQGEQDVQSALDALAAEIAAAACSAAHPLALIPLGTFLEPIQDRVTTVALYPNYVRAVPTGGGAARSVEFPALHLAAPLSLDKDSALVLVYDGFEGHCTVGLA